MLKGRIGVVNEDVGSIEHLGTDKGSVRQILDGCRSMRR